MVKKGYKEIILLAQNVNSYKSESYNFPKLLIELNKITGHFWIRFSSSHPKDLSDELIKAIGSCEKVANHLHIAVQSLIFCNSCFFATQKIPLKLRRRLLLPYQHLIQCMYHILADSAQVLVQNFVNFPPTSYYCRQLRRRAARDDDIRRTMRKSARS